MTAPLHFAITGISIGVIAAFGIMTFMNTLGALAGRKWPIALALAHLVLAIVFGAVNPPFEANDETGHYAYIDSVARTRALPDAMSESDRALIDQSHQPPLYYVLGAVLTGWVADRGPKLMPVTNVFAVDGTNRRGARILLRQPEEAFPWRGAALGVHMARLVSAVMGALMILLVGWSAQIVFAKLPLAAVLSAGLAALNPQIVFMSSMVNNDIMVSLVGAWVVWLLLRIVAAQTVPGWRLFAWLGLALGLGILSKNNSYALVGLGAVILVALSLRRRWPVRVALTNAAATIVPFVAVSLPYFVYSLVRYGRLLVDRNAANPILSAPTSVFGDGIAVALRDQWLPQIFVSAFRQSWGVFGWGTIQYPGIVYDILAIVCAAGLVGFVVGFGKASPALRERLAVMASLGLAMTILPLYRAIYFQMPGLMPGRYLMPAATGYACAIGFGLYSLLGVLRSETARRLCVALPLVSLAFLTAATPWLVLRPIYDAGVRFTQTASPIVTFDGKVQLLAVDAESVTLRDIEGLRQYARVRLTWRALETVDTQLAFGLSVLGANEAVLGMTNVFPAKGNYPSPNWRPGDTWQESHDILIDEPCAQLPILGRVNVAVYEAVLDDAGSTFPTVRAGRRLAATDNEGRPATPIVGRFRIGEAPEMAAFWRPALGMLDGIGLRRISAPTTARSDTDVSVSLTYEMWRNNGKDAIAFVHALDAAGRMVAQDDHAPVGGHYPTDLWRPGECVTESFTLRLPTGVDSPVRLVTGFYESATHERFVTGTPNNTIDIGELGVLPKQ